MHSELHKDVRSFHAAPQIYFKTSGLCHTEGGGGDLFYSQDFSKATRGHRTERPLQHGQQTEVNQKK